MIINSLIGDWYDKNVIRVETKAAKGKKHSK